MKKTKKKKEVLVIRVRAWHQALILPQRIDFVKEAIGKKVNLNFLDIQPIRNFGYYLGYLISFLIMIPRVLFIKQKIILLENPYLTVFSPLLKLQRKKVVTEYVDYYPAMLLRLRETKFLRYLVAKVLCKNLQIFSDVITTESITGKRTLIHWGIPEGKIKIIPVGIDIDKIQFSKEKRNLIRNQFNIPENTLIIGYLGKFVTYYHLDRIIESVALLKDELNPLLLMFIGDGPERGNLENLCNDYQLQSIFTGNVSHTQVSSYYSAMDVFVFPLNSLAIKIGEVLATGLPLIVIQGMAEDWISNEINGIIAKDNSPKHLSKAIKTFFELSDVKKFEIKHQERKFAKENLSIQIVAQKYANLLLR